MAHIQNQGWMEFIKNKDLLYTWEVSWNIPNNWPTFAFLWGDYISDDIDSWGPSQYKDTVLPV